LNRKYQSVPWGANTVPRGTRSRPRERESDKKHTLLSRAEGDVTPVTQDMISAELFYLTVEFSF